MPLDTHLTAEEGDPDRLRAEADELRTVAANIHAAAAMLRTLSTKGVWDSCSGTMFATAVGDTPDRLVQVANRLTDAERIVRPYAERLEDDKRYLEQQRTRYDRYVTISDERLARLEAMTPEDPEYAEADRRYRQAANERQWAKERHDRRKEHALLDEQSVGRRLADAGSDLSDPDGYNGFEYTSRVAAGGFVNNPVSDWTPISTLAAGVAVGKLGRRVFYDEGSYTDVAQSSVGAIVSAISKGKGGQGSAGLTTRRTERRSAELAGVKARYPTTSTSSVATTRWTQRAATSVRRTAATSTVKAKHKAIDTLADKSGARLIDDMTADWAALAGAGHVRKGKHIVTYSAAVGQKVEEQAGTVQTVRDQADRLTETPEEKRARERDEHEEARPDERSLR